MSDPPQSRDSGTHEPFLRRFIESEPEILRYIMATIPSVSDARDVLQETAAALWRKREDYDETMPFTPWACRFAANEIRAFLRRERRQRRWLDEEVAGLLLAHEEARQATPSAADEAAILRECLETLPAPQRVLLRGYYFDEDPVERLAETTARSVEAVYKTLQRARRLLADCVKRKREALT